jgi:spore coat polysaccharide biosynthesis predicted glycosyltransferase SpsG
VVDGGSEVGFGHAGRCLAIAEALDGAAVFELDDPGARRFVADRGGRTEEPADTPVVLLDRATPTAATEVGQLQASGQRVVLLDDFGSGRAGADLVIDPPTAAHWPAAGGPRLAGFEYALVRSEIRAMRRSDEPRDLLVALGGSDPSGATPAVAAALADHDPIVNLGPGYQGPRPEAAQVLTDAREFAAALASAKLLVAAYGHSLLEAAFLGVPAVIADVLAELTVHAKAFVVNGTARLVAQDELAGQVGELVEAGDELERMSQRGRSLVDGRGAERVAEALRVLAA